ncbi:MAG: hypothetical protein V1698_03200 [bacterium]
MQDLLLFLIFFFASIADVAFFASFSGKFPIFLSLALAIVLAADFNERGQFFWIMTPVAVISIFSKSFLRIFAYFYFAYFFTRFLSRKIKSEKKIKIALIYFLPILICALWNVFYRTSGFKKLDLDILTLQAEFIVIELFFIFLIKKICKIIKIKRDFDGTRFKRI